MADLPPEFSGGLGGPKTFIVLDPEDREMFESNPMIGPLTQIMQMAGVTLVYDAAIHRLLVAEHSEAPT